MAHIFKTVMRAENHDFIICQTRRNSKETIILSIPRGKNEEKYLGVIQNKTGKAIIMDTCGFAPKTIEKLKNTLT